MALIFTRKLYTRPFKTTIDLLQYYYYPTDFPIWCFSCTLPPLFWPKIFLIKFAKISLKFSVSSSTSTPIGSKLRTSSCCNVINFGSVQLAAIFSSYKWNRRAWRFCSSSSGQSGMHEKSRNFQLSPSKILITQSLSNPCQRRMKEISQPCHKRIRLKLSQK